MHRVPCCTEPVSQYLPNPYPANFKNVYDEFPPGYIQTVIRLWLRVCGSLYSGSPAHYTHLALSYAGQVRSQSQELPRKVPTRSLHSPV